MVSYGNLQYYQGARYQRGRGFFGRLFTRAILPFIKYLGGKALETGKTVAKDILVDGKDFKSSTKNRLIDTLQSMSDDGINKMKGNGIPRLSIKRSQIQKKKRFKYDFLK